jgi:uncharacterized membrane protein
VALIALAWLRDVPSRILVPVSLGILILHPLFDVSALPVAIQAILYEPVRSGAFRSMYPVFPWIGIVLLGFVVGRDARRNEKPARLWLALAAISLIAFVLTRASGGYGNAFAYTTVDSFAFWTFAKYPPDLPFLTWSFACIFVALAALSRVAGNGVPAVLRPFELFGRVPFFFFVVHFYVLGVAQAILLTRTDLPTTYLIWALLMLGMAWPCAWYYRKKRERPNLITRHF